MRIILTVFILSLVLLNSCTKCSNDTKKKNNKEVKEQVAKPACRSKLSGSEKAGSNNDYDSGIGYEETRIDLYISGAIIPPDKLKDYLPETIAGTQSVKPSTGIIYGETDNVSTVSITYDFGKGGLVMRITDYGTKENIPSYDLKYFDVLPTKPGYERETIIDEMGKGYILWNVEDKSGEMYYFLANRFIIKLEGYTMPSGTGGLVFFFDKIKRKELIEKMKKN
jgi:hypothetical protein